VQKDESVRSEALELAIGALEHRDRSAAELRDRLHRRGIPAAECEDALAALTRSGLVDDDRFASTRAAALASRGYGNAAIDADLEERGLARELRQRALGGLEPEPERARALVERRGPGARTARYLVSRGFDAEVVRSACEKPFASDL
jgi:regulatory protein